ncbi:HesA/MoeB/ThiF family protein [Pontibacillus salipaludis]|uniref:Thiamine/molybdopterin biosynthesis protein n=1 Tax=Pontibacillus salipaludis TaxID=1697394 RepID=A0ABQ1QA26_9BACI|nr:ThiF family adenylyltransferase [Pontibacillus salipaludis]GGD18695.1 thiamine/molybdopterin biosynthesis protein [Pontibacillus salipaludis]
MNAVFKRTLRPVVQMGNELQIGMNENHTTLDDPDGLVFQLTELLDGTHSNEEVAVKLGISMEEVEGAIAALDGLGFIESSEVPGTFKDSELERYEANLNYYSSYSNLETSKYSFQEKLKGAKVAVIGLGGGCLTTAYLAGLGVGEIRGLDFDTVGRSNLNRQFIFNENDIGRLKSEVAQEKVEAINPDISVTMYNREITSHHDLLDIIDGCDIVLSMIDSPTIVCSRWVNAACYIKGIPYIQGGFMNKIVVWERFDPAHGSCYDCRLIDSIVKDPSEEYRLRTVYNLIFSRRNTGFAPHVSMLTGFFASEVVKYITDYANVSKAYSQLNTETMELVQQDHQFERVPTCPTCGEKAFEEISSLDELIESAKEMRVPHG